LPAIEERILLQVIGSIYDCVVAPERWKATLEGIQQIFKWHNAILAANSLIGQKPNIQVILGVPDKFLQIAVDPSYTQPILELWGGMQKVMDAPLEEPLVQSQMGNPQNWSDNRYFADFVIPQGIVDAVTVGLARDPTMVATISGGRHGSAGPFTSEELDGLRVLAPHLRRAVSIANLFDDMHADRAMFTATLDASRAGIILVDDRMSIIHANGNAHRMISAGDPIREIAGKLMLREELSPGALASAMSLIHDNGSTRSGSGIPTRRRDGSALLIHILPLTGSTVRTGLVQKASAAVFVAPAHGQPNLPIDALATLYDLTPAEARVMELTTSGLSLNNAALKLGIAPSTVKTHLLRVYVKTGTHRRSELTTLARNISPF
jgi:DNA-binding CsgD family transcriptional regulator